MNRIYRIIWNSALSRWVVASELSRGKTKSKLSSAISDCTLTSMLNTHRLLLRTLISTILISTATAGAADITIDPTITPDMYNYYAGTTLINGNTVNMTGNTSFTGSSGINSASMTLINGYKAGYITGADDPNDLYVINSGAKNASALVADPVTGGAIVVNTYDSSKIVQLAGGGTSTVGIYFPTAEGKGPFVQSQIANVTGGGVLNFSVSGIIGNGSVKDTVYINVNDGEANWNSVNTVQFANNSSNNVGPDLSPLTWKVTTQTYSGTFTVNTADGPQPHTVNNINDLRNYNSWLIQQLTDGKLGSGNDAQSNYDAAFTAAYRSSVHSYDVNRNPQSIPDTDPIFIPQGIRAAMAADGVNAVARIGSTGAITSSSGYGLYAYNGGTVINEGKLITYGPGVLGGIYVDTGGHGINNGLRFYSTESGVRTESGTDTVTGAGSTYINNGTMNLAGWSWNTTSSVQSTALRVNSGAVATNYGAINVGTTPLQALSFLVGINMGGTNSRFINETDGVLYLGRGQSYDTTSASIERGGDDVEQPNGGRLVHIGGSGGTVNNKGTMIIGDKVQNGTALFAAVTSAVNVVNNGIIEVRGHYSAQPISNYGIRSASTASNTVVDNAGIINLTGMNVIGIHAFNGGKASSSGVINVAGGAEPATGLRNYGIWSQNANSKITLSGTVNLAGDGAIGVHARDGGSIGIEGLGQINFVSGTDQIGFFVYGPSAQLTNTGAGVMNVSTENSTLFRMEDGADFTGGSGASSVLTASGKNSTLVMATGLTGGDVSAFNSGGMTLNLTGEGSTGVLVEGGAQGKIDANAIINLSGVGAIAAIADGQKRDLSGNVVGSQVAGVLSNEALNAGAAGFGRGTVLVAGANLNSSLDNVTGYIARNHASLTNSGNITFSGKNATGIRVAEGAVGANSGNITLDGSGSVGLVATADTTHTQLSSTGNIVLNGNWNGVDDGTRTTGVLANGSQVAVTVGDGVNEASINLNGAGAVGVHASGGSTVTLKDKVAINFDTTKSQQVVFWIEGEGSKIITQAGNVLTNVIGDGATLFFVTDNATLSGALNLNLAGVAGSDKVTSGIRVRGGGAQATLSSGSQITVGTHATGVLAEASGKAVIEQNVTFSVTGSNAVVGKSTGNGAIVENHASVTSVAGSRGSTAFLAENGGLVDNKGNIDLSSGIDHTAIDVDNGHVINTGNISASGTAVHIKGARSTINNSGVITATDGVAAIHVDDGAGLDLSAVSGSGTIIAKGSADGILLDQGALGLNVANTVIDMSDTTSSGIGIHNVAGIAGIQLDNTEIKVGGSGIGIKTGASLALTNSGSISVTDGTGILYLNEDGSAMAANIDFSQSADLTINVDGSGIGVKATLDGHERTVNTGASVNIRAASGGSAIDVAGAKSVTNSGNLISRSTVADGNVLNVHGADTISNSGTIASSSANIAAIAMSNIGNKTFTNTGSITGFVDFATGDNLINLAGGSLVGNVKASGGTNTVMASDGSLHVGDVILTGSKAQTVTVKGGSTLGNLVMTGSGDRQTEVKQLSTVGTVTLGDGNNQLLVDASNAGNITTGNGDSTLTFINASLSDIATGNGNNQLNLYGTSAAGALITGSGNNHLTLQDSASIGSFVGGNGNNILVIKNSATFGSLDAGTGGADDSLTFDGIDYTLANTADIQHFDRLNLTNGTGFTTAQQIQLGDTALSAGRIVIDGTSSLILNPVAAYTLNHELNGSGLVDVQSGTTFDFGVASGHLFSGLVQMNSTDFALSGLNSIALTNAELSVMGNNTTTVGLGNQTIGRLTLDGGTIDFGSQIPGGIISRGTITVNDLNASKTGQVKLVRSSIDSAAVTVPDQTLGLLDQQNQTLIQLVRATAVTGHAGNLNLTDENGNIISASTGIAVMQGGVHAADAGYDYRLTTKDNGGNANGLYAGYGLSQLNLLAQGGNRLVINTAASNEKVLSAKVIGSGDLGIYAADGSGALTLSNLNNNYTGATDLQNGTLITATDNALGQTSTLNLAVSTTANMNGTVQTIGALNGTAGSTLQLNGANLTLTNGGTSSGWLTGAGNLTVAGGTLTVKNANSALSATTTVSHGAEVRLKDVQSLGFGEIVADGKVTLSNINGTFANRFSGSGQLNSHAGSNVRLIGNNSGFTGAIDIDSTSVLTVSETQQIGGASGILNANRFIVDNAESMTLAAIISGNGELVKTSAGTLTVSGNNSYSGQTDIQNGTLAISSDTRLGNGQATNLTVLNGGHLQITADLISNRHVTLAKAGSVIVDQDRTAVMNGWDDLNTSTNTFTKAGAGTLIWTSNNSANTAQVNVSGGTLQVDNLTQLASANGVVNLGAGGTLTILKTVADNVDFTRQLSGSGKLAVNLGGQDNDFSLNSTSAGGHFSGLVSMDSGRLMLNADAENTLSQAMLQLNIQGSTKLNGTRNIGGLTMNGGQLEVDYNAIDYRPEGFLTVNTLDVTGGGNLAITSPGNLPNLLPATGASLFDQDDNAGDRIVAASAVNGVGSQLAITRVDGTAVAPDTIITLTQGVTQVGNAHYNYFGAVKSDGLYLGYGLTQLDAFAGQSVILDNSNAVDNGLGAKLTGDGGFTIKATGTVRIGNAASDYTGVTDINSGNVELITHNGFGQTSALNMHSGTSLNMNGNRQAIGELNSMFNSVLALNGGELTINAGGLIDGNLTGNGQLNLTGGILTLTQNNRQFTGATHIDVDASARLTASQGLGQGIITNEGRLNIDSAKGTLLNSLKGGGDALLTNGADITLVGDSSGYSGSFTIDAGTILTATEVSQLGSAVINNVGTFVADATGLWTLDNTISGSGTFVKRGSGTVQVDGDNLSVSLTNIENGLLLIGGAPAGSILNRAASANLLGDVIIRKDGALGGYGTVTGNVSNSGNLLMGHALTGNAEGVFTINGNYHGDNGTVVFSPQLDDDRLATDRLVITGDSTGQSTVMVTSARGDGALTTDGIKLIDVQGTSTGQFALSGRAIAGAYEYFLYQGAISTPDDGDWYLRSVLNSGNPDPSVYRPEAGGYLANMAAAGNLFSLRLEDREGRAENSSMWLRQTGSRNKHRDSSGQLHTATNSYVVQGGGEVFGSDIADSGRFGLGLMAAYGKADSKSNSRTTGYQANSTIDGYSTGVYGTWYQDARTLNGAYVDSWIQYSWLDAEVKGQEVANESYDMNGFSASVETGYRLPVYQGLNGDVYFTPQAQIVWNGIKADDHTEANGTRVRSSGNDNVQTRLGMKVSRDGVSDRDKGSNKLFTTYAEINWLYNSQQSGAVMDGVEVKQGGSRHVAELKLGVEGQLNQHINLWTNVGQRLGNEGYSDTSVNLGVKYRF